MIVETDTAVRSDFITALRIIYHEGLSDAFAHLSARSQDGSEMLFMPRKSPALVQHNDLFFVDFEKTVPQSALHQAIYKAPQLVPPGVADEKNKLAPSDYFRKNFHWTIETEEPEFAEAVQYLGADHFLFATDYPHDDPGGRMKHKDVELLAAHPKLSEGDKEKIRCANARQLFRLGSKETAAFYRDARG